MINNEYANETNGLKISENTLINFLLSCFKNIRNSIYNTYILYMGRRRRLERYSYFRTRKKKEDIKCSENKRTLRSNKIKRFSG